MKISSCSNLEWCTDKMACGEMAFFTKQLAIIPLQHELYLMFCIEILLSIRFDDVFELNLRIMPYK